MITKDILHNVAKDVAASIAEQIIQLYTKNNWITEDEEKDLSSIADKVAKSNILLAFEGFCE